MFNVTTDNGSKSPNAYSPLIPDVAGILAEINHHLLQSSRLVDKLLDIQKQNPDAHQELCATKQHIQTLSQLINAADRDLRISADRVFVEPVEKTAEKILIIEDEFEVRHFVKSVLAEKYEIIESSNGSEGYEKALALMPDLIISDIMMPGMDGLALCRKIKNDVKTSHIPIILLTARAEAEQRLQGYEAGADAYINKPFNVTELVLRVGNLMETLSNQRKKYAHDIFQTPRHVTTNGTDEKFLHHAIRFIEDNIDDPQLDISGLADELNMSSSNLYRKIKSITGLSSIDFVINHKMKYAAHLLLSGKHSVKEVAYMTGFTDSRYFSTRFKKYFQYTPTEYIEFHFAQSEVKSES